MALLHTVGTYIRFNDEVRIILSAPSSQNLTSRAFDPGCGSDPACEVSIEVDRLLDSHHVCSSTVLGAVAFLVRGGLASSDPSAPPPDYCALPLDSPEMVSLPSLSIESVGNGPLG